STDRVGDVTTPFDRFGGVGRLHLRHGNVADAGHAGVEARRVHPGEGSPADRPHGQDAHDGDEDDIEAAHRTAVRASPVHDNGAMMAVPSRASYGGPGASSRRGVMRHASADPR